MVEIDGAITVPEDEGTGLSENEGDWTSAGHFAGLSATANTTDYVDTGLTLDVDWSVPSVDISSGLAYVSHQDGVSVQDVAGLYVREWGERANFAVALPAVSDIPLTSGAMNHVFLVLDPGENNGARYDVLTGDSEPSDPSLKVGAIDTGEQEYGLPNRGPKGIHGAVNTKRTVELGDTVHIPEDHSQVVSSEYTVDGELVVEGELKVI